MMSLREHRIKSEYRSLIDNVVQDFYIPLLKDAVVYRRAVGFFSSSSLAEISKGIAALAKSGGKIQIVASPYLSEEDSIRVIRVLDYWILFAVGLNVTEMSSNLFELIQSAIVYNEANLAMSNKFPLLTAM